MVGNFVSMSRSKIFMRTRIYSEFFRCVVRAPSYQLHHLRKVRRHTEAKVNAPENSIALRDRRFTRYSIDNIFTPFPIEATRSRSEAIGTRKAITVSTSAPLKCFFVFRSIESFRNSSRRRFLIEN